MGARIKTKEEFVREYGEMWKTIQGGPVDWNEEGMEHLFGLPLTKDAADTILTTGRWSKIESTRTWAIDKNMVVFDPNSALDMERFSSWPPVDGHAKWWSGLASTAH